MNVSFFKKHITDQHLFSIKDTLVLAVSGGVDSVVLCELCKQAGYDFIIAHCNFQLRGAESERDEQFVQQLGEKYGVEVKLKRFDTEQYAAANKLSIQEAARALRYAWFEELVRRRKSEVVSQESEPGTRSLLLTAHHADDNAETLLMNFFRGTGLHGLTGIPASVNYIRRPLLPFSKEELQAFAKEEQLDYVEDSSNQSSKYTRNFFRNEIIPAISKVYPQVKANLQDNIERFKAIEKLYQLSVGAIKKKLLKEKGSEVHIPVKQLMGYHNRALIYEIIKDYGFQEKQVEELVKLSDSDSGRYIESPLSSYRIIKHRHWFIISPVQSIASTAIVIEEKDKQVIFEQGILQVEITSDLKPAWPAGRPETSNLIASIDFNKVIFPLLLRKWKTGDYFYPLGMTKKKKLSRFFIDQKLSKTEKENAWVIESNKRIIWVVGHRIDERVKIVSSTKKTLKLSLHL
ncbi:MAG: tRNA lysidine(34) synthetase TilS [Chitinophagales bacterium]|nr:tRNA lysidine(34) synthetase TilS [Chitinophagales bacterium]